MIDKNGLQYPQEKFGGQADEVSLIDIGIILAKNKKNILMAMILALIAAVGVTLLLANKYTAKAQLMPPQSQSGSSALLGQLGALSGLAGGGGSALKNPNDIYVGMLESRTVADALIDRFKLQTVYDVKLKSEARNALKRLTTVVNGKEGLISIEVTDEDPKLAATITNAYVEELQKMTKTLAVTEAGQRRLFFERQLQQAKEALADAEVALKQVQEKTGLIKLNEQAEAMIQASAGLKAQIAAKEVALGAMRTFSTTSNPEYVRVQQELIGFRVQLSKLETGMNGGKGDISISTSSVPEVGLEYTRRLRDVKYQEVIFEMLAKQMELAKVDEAKEGAVLQLLDSAIVPDKKSKPARSIIVIISVLLAGILAVCWAFLKEASKNARLNLDNAAKLDELGKVWRWRKNLK